MQANCILLEEIQFASILEIICYQRPSNTGNIFWQLVVQQYCIASSKSLLHVLQVGATRCTKLNLCILRATCCCNWQRAITPFNLQCSIVAQPVARKCFPYYFTLINCTCNIYPRKCIERNGSQTLTPVM